ncbi:expressed unknown protein [Seminavis robusta]|uniref:Uncharacterized protein n=1 Tax=Seminavis robusta TaxID=568900 RepID=A0A9N8DM12_9STRA|nr:expressed unknown protein [Seminavis robusta]|eukprot:Sro219_g090270.1 n/a (356) ;mRNA; r:3986-5053
MNLDERLLALGVPPDIQVEGGDEILLSEDSPGCCKIRVGSSRFAALNPNLSFADLAIVLPSIGHRFTSLMLKFFSDLPVGLSEAQALQLGTTIQNNLPNITSVTINGFVDDRAHRILVQHLPQHLESLSMDSCRFHDLPSALAQIPDSLKGLKSLTLSEIFEDNHGTQFFQSVANAIQALPNLEHIRMDFIQSNSSEHWDFVFNAILKHDNIKRAEFEHLWDSPGFTFDDATENNIVCHVGINRVKAMLGGPSKTTNTSDDHFQRWVVAVAAFRNQPACLQYLFSPVAMDPAKFAQAALDAINQVDTQSNMEHQQKKRKTAPSGGHKPHSLETGHSEERLRRLERARVFTHHSIP